MAESENECSELQPGQETSHGNDVDSVSVILSSDGCELKDGELNKTLDENSSTEKEGVGDSLNDIKEVNLFDNYGQYFLF